MGRRTVLSLVLGAALVIALAVSLVLKANAPPEAARLLPESDAIVFLQVHALRAATHFDASPLPRSAEFQRFIDATGIVPERDLDTVAIAFHRMPDPHGPNGSVAFSEVFTGHFDGERLRAWLHANAAGEETYAGRTVFSLPIEAGTPASRTLRVAQLSYDTVAASNTPSVDAIHSMLDRAHRGGLWVPGSSLLAARYRDVPLLSQAWGVGRIGLPFANAGELQVLGLELPLPADTEFVASLRYEGQITLRVMEIAPDAATAERTVGTLSNLLALTRGLTGAADSPSTPAAAALHDVLNSVTFATHGDRALLTATATADQLRALSVARP